MSICTSPQCVRRDVKELLRGVVSHQQEQMLEDELLSLQAGLVVGRVSLVGSGTCRS